MSAPTLEWKRPSEVPYPVIWKTFKALDLDKQHEVEYRIQDLPESMYEDAIKHMLENYLRDEPIANCWSKFKFIK